MIELAPAGRAVGGSDGDSARECGGSQRGRAVKELNGAGRRPRGRRRDGRRQRDVLPEDGRAGEKETVVVDVGVWASVTVTVGEVSPLKLVSPRYCAVIELVPAARVDVGK